MLAFSDPQVIDLVRRHFVAVAGDDLVQSHRRDAEGDFFRGLMDPVSRGIPSDSPQGIYVCSAKGTLLDYQLNPSQDMDEASLLRKVLTAFEALPASERTPGAVQVPDLIADPQADPQPPADGMIVRVSTRRLKRQGHRYVADTTPLDIHNMHFAPTAQQDHLWITHDEMMGMVPARLQPGERVAMPDSLATRLCTLYLNDTTRDGAGWWQNLEITDRTVTFTVQSVGPQEATLRIDGKAHFGRNRGEARTMQARFQGLARYDLNAHQFITWDMVVLGDLRYLWGTQWIEQPMGFAFEKADGQLSTDQLPPRKISYRRQPG